MKPAGRHRLFGRSGRGVVPLLCACAAVTAEAAGVDGFVPDWAADAVWYQVFVSRFCSGNAGNDPPGTLPWTHDWAKLAAGERPPLRERLLERRYGGDLQGLRSRLPRLRELGVNTLYLSPIFQAPSEHKYDTADHRHVDDTYGVADPQVAQPRLIGETEDPNTWQWTASDRVFLDFLADAHRQGFRVVLDGVFNHVGREFRPWRDVRSCGRASRYAEWFDVTAWGPGDRGVKSWQAWDGPNGRLIRFKRSGDGLHRDVEAYLFAVVRRWMDPDGDGDPADGVDGWRLDAAEQVPHGFWRRFRQVVKEINPQAILVGEIWTRGSDWLDGDQFDAVTNYRFSALVMRFFSQGGNRYTATAFAEDLAAVRWDHPGNVTRSLLNVLGTHDTERAATMLTDPQRRREALGRIPERDTLKPDEDAYRRLKLAAFFQFTYPGAPLIYYGDEVGMYGGGDPFCRAPRWWPEGGATGYRSDVLEFYRKLIRLRRSREELRRGTFHLILADDARRLIAFSRRGQAGETIVVVNGDTTDHQIVLNVGHRKKKVELTVFHTECIAGADPWVRVERTGSDGRLETACPALCGQLIVLAAKRPDAPGSARANSD